MFKNKKIIDISWPITNRSTTYKNNKLCQIKTIKNYSDHRVRDSDIFLNAHTGTHIDAPSHFLPKDIPITSYQLKQLMGKALILDCTHITDVIKQSDLINLLKTYSKYHEKISIFFKTSNSFLSPTDPFNTNFVYLAACAAAYLAKQNIQAIGIDYLGIERNQPNHETHTILLEQDIPIIEGLRLAHVMPGLYDFICLPLALQETEAAPARALLFE